MPPILEKSTRIREEASFPRKLPAMTEKNPSPRDRRSRNGTGPWARPVPSPAATLSKEREMPRKKASRGDRRSGSS